MKETKVIGVYGATCSCSLTLSAWDAYNSVPVIVTLFLSGASHGENLPFGSEEWPRFPQLLRLCVRRSAKLTEVSITAITIFCFK